MTLSQIGIGKVDNFTYSTRMLIQEITILCQLIRESKIDIKLGF